MRIAATNLKPKPNLILNTCHFEMMCSLNMLNQCSPLITTVLTNVFREQALRNGRSRILFTVLLSVEAVHASHDLLQTADPTLGLLFGWGHQVQVLSSTFEDNGEAAVVCRGVRVLLQPFSLTAIPHRIDVLETDCKRGKRFFIITHFRVLTDLTDCILNCLSQEICWQIDERNIWTVIYNKTAWSQWHIISRLIWYAGLYMQSCII